MAEMLRRELKAAVHVAQHPGYSVIVKVGDVHFTCLYLQVCRQGLVSQLVPVLDVTCCAAASMQQAA